MPTYSRKGLTHTCCGRDEGANKGKTNELWLIVCGRGLVFESGSGCTTMFLNMIIVRIKHKYRKFLHIWGQSDTTQA